MFRLFLVLVLTLSTNPIFACSIPYPETALGKSELIAHAGSIALVKPIHAERMGRYTNWSFKIVERLKGDLEEGTVVTVNLLAAGEAIREMDFERHEMPGFWDVFLGRLPWLPGECTPRYEFESGGTYMLFLDAMANSASAERINDKSDKWYRFVVDEVSKSNAQ